MPPGNILTSLQAHTLAREAGSSEQMVSPGCQVCSTLGELWGTGFFGPCSSPPLPLPRVAVGATRDVGLKGDPARGGEVWEHETPVPGGARACCARPPSPLTRVTWQPARPPHLPSLRSSAFLPPPPLFLSFSYLDISPRFPLPTPRRVSLAGRRARSSLPAPAPPPIVGQLAG